MVQTEHEDLSAVLLEAGVLYVTRIQKERFASKEVREKEKRKKRRGLEVDPSPRYIHAV